MRTSCFRWEGDIQACCSWRASDVTAMARSGAGGRICYLALFLTAAIVMYQHHKSMQREITHNRNSRDKFEKMYDEVLKQEAEWRGKHEKEKMRSAALQEANDEVKKQFTSEMQSKQTLQSEKAELELKLEQEQSAKAKAEADQKAKESQLAQALADAKAATKVREDLEDKVATLTEEVMALKEHNSELMGKVEKAQQQIEAQAQVQGARSTFSRSDTIGQQQQRARDVEEDVEETVASDSSDESAGDKARRMATERHTVEDRTNENLGYRTGSEGGADGDRGARAEGNSLSSTDVNTSQRERGYEGGSTRRTYSSRSSTRQHERKGGLVLHWR